MDIKEIQCIIESILFAVGDAVSRDKLVEVLELDKQTLSSIIKQMQDYYNYERRGVQIIELEGSYQLCSRPEYSSYIRKIVEPKKNQKLSNAALETLAIISYNQPVTRSNIEQIRGVNSDASINTLLEKELIEEKGRLNAPGKPILFGTTQEFLRCFGLRALDELPKLDGFESFTPLE